MRNITALSSALILVACSGGGGGSTGSGSIVTPTPTPSPSASASPTPTPSPTASYTKFADLTGDLTLASACTAIRITAPPIVSPASLPDQGLAFTYASGAQSWGVTGDGLALTFTAAERDPTLPTQVIGYNKTSSTPTERLRIATVGIGTTPAEYFRTATVTANAPGANGRNYTCIVGVKTLVTDAPAGTTFNFPNSRIAGFLFRVAPPGGGAQVQYSMNNTTVGFDVNLATGEVKLVIHLIGSPNPAGSGADVDFGTLTGIADIDPATGAYYGTSWTSPDMAITFPQVSGRFFGPQGKESGYVLTLIANKPDGSQIYISGSGVALR